MSEEPFVVARPRLVCVVELEPGAYATRPHEPPRGPEDSDRYWRESLADAGLHLEPLARGSWLVRATQLVDERALRAIFDVHVRDFDDGPPRTLEALTEELGSLCGGVALLDGERVALEPGCCADLAGLSDWEAAATSDAADWQTLWNGHPWASSRVAGERVLIRKEAEHGAPPPPVLLSVERAALHEAVKRADEERRALATRLAPIVRAWLGDDAWLDEALALLVGLRR